MGDLMLPRVQPDMRVEKKGGERFFSLSLFIWPLLFSQLFLTKKKRLKKFEKGHFFSSFLHLFSLSPSPNHVPTYHLMERGLTAFLLPILNFFWLHSRGKIYELTNLGQFWGQINKAGWTKYSGGSWQIFFFGKASFVTFLNFWHLLRSPMLFFCFEGQIPLCPSTQEWSSVWMPDWDVIPLTQPNNGRVAFLSRCCLPQGWKMLFFFEGGEGRRAK